MGYFSKDKKNLIGPEHVVGFNEEIESLTVITSKHYLRFLLISGKSLDEPVVWGGPIVMNTKEELNQAFAELKNNTFIKEK